MNRLPLLFLVLFSLIQIPLHARIVSDSIPSDLIQSSSVDREGEAPPPVERIALLRSELEQVDRQIESFPIASEEADFKQQFALLSRKLQLSEQLKVQEGLYELDLTKKRYKKGIDLIKMVYEKILGLDHHFSSVRTFQNVMSLSNPNSYPEFQKSRELLEGKLRKENSLKLPALLETNPYLSTTFSVVASLIGSGPTKDRKQELDDISCLLDFTARMNSELSTIFYETEYLRESNTALKEECLDLFKDYVEVVEYHITLDKCRKEDDWENLYEKLNSFISNLETEIQDGGVSPGNYAYKQQINLEFAVDRLVEFINKYNQFISQGEKYYQKFRVIVSSYPNEDLCQNELPHNFRQLQEDIDYAIVKFNEAYNISELTGSKLKDLLYGFSD
ncbi:MAG: hypothetical protein AAFW73_15510 [Bacteroidota bacterium]